MIAMAETKGEFAEGPGFETGGTANLTTSAHGFMSRRVTIAANRSSMAHDGSCESDSRNRKTLMTPARAATYLVGAILLAAWLASAAGVARPHLAPVPRRSAESMQLDAVALTVQSQAARLRQRLAAAPILQAPSRNPFTFAAREPVIVPAAAVRPRTLEAPVVANPPLPEPALVLLGVAEQGSTRTAMVGFGDELLMATEGQTLANRYRVAKVGADAIELVDLGTGATRRLFLRSPV